MAVAVRAMPSAPWLLVDAEERHLAGRAGVPAHELTADDDPGAEPLTREHADRVVRAVCHTASAFADRGEVAVVLDQDELAQRALQCSAEVQPPAAGKGAREQHLAAGRVDTTGAAAGGF
jgi:hypothetical protein